jgi:hypothetical protein
MLHCFEPKNANLFRRFFGENIYKIITVPELKIVAKKVIEMFWFFQKSMNGPSQQLPVKKKRMVDPSRRREQTHDCQKN